MPITVNRSAVLGWYDANRRDLPWRDTRDPYAVWVSEIMLQQTQVATVLPYYRRWMSRFPTVEILAVAEEQDVLSLWQGLGYYRRCRMFLAGARWVVQNGIPSDAAGWMKVPGVGRYTSAAIASISRNEPVAVMDGNVERVFARFTGSDSSDGALGRAAWGWAASQLDPDRPGDWNQALMELGATVCRPRGPLCDSCPLAPDCIARREGRQSELPRPKKQTPAISLKREAFVHRRRGQFGLEQIPEGEWWQGMWRFSTSALSGSSREIGLVRHVVTRHRIAMTVHLVDCDEPEQGLTWFSLEELKHLPMPAPQRRAFELALVCDR